MASAMAASRTTMPQAMDQSGSQYQSTFGHGIARADMELLFRNAQLETELRLVKEQLAQARQSTQYLLQLMSGVSSDKQQQHTSNCEPRLQYAADQPSPRNDSILDATETASRITTSSKLVNLGDEEQLLLDDDAEAPIDTPSLIPEVHLPHRKHVEDSTGLGVCLGISPNSDSFTSTEANTFSLSNSSSNQQPGFSIHQSDGTALFIPTAPTNQTPQSSFPSTSSPTPFLGHEHRSLAGKAFVWADMSPKELTEVVERYAREHPRHSAEEYREYFEEVVRPGYYRREEEKRVAREGWKEGGWKRAEEGEGGSRVQAAQDGQVGEDGDGEHASTGPPPEHASKGPPPGGDVDPIREQEHIEAHELVVKRVAANVIKSLTEVLPRGLEHSMHADPVFTPSTKTSEAAFAAAADNVAPQIEGDSGVSLCVDAPVGSAPATCPSQEQVEAEIQEERSSYIAAPTSIAGYQPPRLFNPDGLDDAKLLQAEFQNGSASRGRRGRDYPPRPPPRVESDNTPIASEERSIHIETQTSHRRDSKDPGTLDRLRRAPASSSSYITYPYSVPDLFATPPTDETHPYRTVLISDIPRTTTLAHLLDQVRGGKIFSALPLDTAGMRTNPPLVTNSALITFIKGRDASKFAKHCAVQPENYILTAQLLKTVSRPISARLQADIQQLNLTRILFIHDTSTEQVSSPDEVVNELVRRGVRIPLKAEADAEVPGLMLFHFASLAEAKMAWNVVQRDRAFFGDVASGFFADPCGKPIGRDDGGGEGCGEVEELAEEPVEGGDGSGEANDDLLQAAEKGEKGCELGVANGQCIYSEVATDATMLEG